MHTEIHMAHDDFSHQSHISFLAQPHVAAAAAN